MKLTNNRNVKKILQDFIDSHAKENEKSVNDITDLHNKNLTEMVRIQTLFIKKADEREKRYEEREKRSEDRAIRAEDRAVRAEEVIMKMSSQKQLVVSDIVN